MNEQEEFEFRARLEAESAARVPKPTAGPAPSKPFGQQLNDAIADVPRQVGLTARYGLEGAGDALDFVASPVRAGLNALLPTRKPTITDLVSTRDAVARPAIEGRSGKVLADMLNLPEPRTATERVVGDAARLIAGGGGTIGAASRASRALSGTSQAVARTLASNPGQQLASAGAAGLAGGYTRETGGNDSSQLLASLAAGVATPLAMGGAQRAAGSIARRARSAAPTPEQTQQINITINNALQSSGLTLEQFPAQVAQSIRDDVAKAFRTTDQVSPDALRRLADYRLTGLTPTAAGLTLDPAVVSQQKNLAKMGINSKDKTAQFLGETENRNNQLLKSGLSNLGAPVSIDTYAGGERIISALAGREARAQKIIGGLYDKARDSGGRSAALDPHSFTQRAGNLLHEANVESFLTPDIRNKLNGFADGSIPLTVEIAEQFKTSIGRLQRSSADGNVRYALGAVRQALDETPLINQRAPAPQFGGDQLATQGGLVAGAGQQAQDLGQEALGAFTKARRTNRSWMQIVERTPALQAVRDGVEPDKFVQQFIVGAGKDASITSVAQLKHSIKASPDAMAAVREQILGHLKNKALGGMSDETGNFGSKAYIDALGAIGDRKLRLFFEPAEIAQMKALGRVARYEQFQPAGSAVNNSNTAGAAGALLERLLNTSILSKVPFGQAAIGDPLQNITVGLQSGRALNVPKTLALPRLAPRRNAGMGLMASPALLMTQPEEKERPRGLLAP